MENIIIRNIKKEDIPTVVNIQINGWRTAYKGIIDSEFLNLMNAEEIIEKCERDYNQNGFIVAEQNGKVVAFCRYIDSNRFTTNVIDIDCELLAMYVEPSLRNNGIGTKLFQYVINEFKNKSKKQMILWCLKDNESSKNFYEEMGGRIVKEKVIEIGNKRYYEVGFVYNL